MHYSIKVEGKYVQVKVEKNRRAACLDSRMPPQTETRPGIIRRQRLPEEIRESKNDAELRSGCY